MSHRAVIFDLGGVVLGSPLHAIADYEREHDVAAGSVNRLIVANGPDGAWARLERGELELEPFFALLDAEFAEAELPLSARILMERVGEAAQPRPAMLTAVAAIRTRGLRAAALTNNWRGEGDGTRVLEPLFDLFVESSVLGLRKPDPRIYAHVLRELDLEPPHTVFLDDIGGNLKPARELGMHTIKVDDPDTALSELADVLGFPLE